jgi:hypothetical protein
VKRKRRSKSWIYTIIKEKTHEIKPLTAMATLEESVVEIAVIHEAILVAAVMQC